MIGDSVPPSLREASERFSTFLRENDYSERVFWVDVDDVVWDGRILSVREHPNESMWDRACRRYSDGIKNGFGIALYAFSQTDGSTIAAIIWPKNHDEAQRHLVPVGGIKLSAATRKLHARFIRNRFGWLILLVRHRTFSRSFWNDYLSYS
jgi:hypothetical protein